MSLTETTEATIDTFKQAFNVANNAEPLVHTDRGAAYTSSLFNDFMFQKNTIRSMSRPGIPYDNSLMERYWNEFKVRWLRTHPCPTTYGELEMLVAEGVKYFNTIRHSEKRNGLTPEEFRHKAISKQLIA
ncbi:DDE-type integrase/transposase/recombinase [Periweissella fabaria]|uniref:integrase core domain-containing protein n=1 Tax=Periweissella fabaria TaxID=546157 RepID=UPI001E2C8305|nr:integrase core domain-containing protein [Periweissella fabaria]MCM0597252.1 DDE-type integrase/transposase/recombinase [Periweissella fabaria]